MVSVSLKAANYFLRRTLAAGLPNDGAFTAHQRHVPAIVSGREEAFTNFVKRVTQPTKLDDFGQTSQISDMMWILNLWKLGEVFIGAEVQVEIHVKSAWIQHFKETCDEVISSFAFNCNLRRYASGRRS
jgi:hypothetical protein